MNILTWDGLVKPSPATGNSAVAPRTHPRVLVLDREPVVRSLLRRFLHEHGYDAVEADSVGDARRTLDAGPVAAVILDVRLSGGRSGIGMLTELSSHPGLSSASAIVMTGAPLSDEELSVITQTQAHLLYKPEGLSTLIAFLEEVTGRH